MTQSRPRVCRVRMALVQIEYFEPEPADDEQTGVHSLSRRPLAVRTVPELAIPRRPRGHLRLVRAA